MGYVLLSAPAIEPVTRDEAKLWCRIDGTAEQDLIDALIVASRQCVEKATRRSLISQTWRGDFPRFPCAGEYLRLAQGPVQSVTSVYYYDDQGADTLLDSAAYKLDLTEKTAKIRLAPDADWPSIEAQADAVRVTYVAGYGAAASAVPRALRQAMLMLIAYWYDNRGGQAMPMAVTALIDPYVIPTLA
jgi:uncharacterized phiE125 gp8 family phage protein